MLYIGLKCADLRGPQFIGSEPLDRATWLCLLRYCVEQMNHGYIENCADWKDRQWQQAAGVFQSEVDRKCALWKREGKGIRVWAYPHDQHKRFEDSVKAGRKGAKTRWGKNGTHRQSPGGSQPDPPESRPSVEAP